MKPQRKQTGITLFYSYVSADRQWRDQLAVHLSQLKRDGAIEELYDDLILAGEEYSVERNRMLRSAQIILLLVSADFLASDACCQDEMQRAWERHRRGEARVIPIIVRPCDWQHSPFAHLQCLPRNNKPVASWSNQDEALAAIAQEIRKIIARQRFSDPPLSHIQRRNRARLLKRVHTIWIKGLLENSLHQVARIDLHFQEQPNALDNPLRLQAQELDQAPQVLPDGTTIVQVYDEANGELLILGEPGSGKTTLLLELARTLLERAEKDEQLPMPIVFNLSSWTEKCQSLRVWLVEELTKYQVPQKIGQSWIDDDRVLPLLDGLDEVAEEVRRTCIEQINTYHQFLLERGSNSMVVCCRSEAYSMLSTRIRLQQAVTILPLIDAQIKSSLERTGKQVQALREVLNEDLELRNLARQPLMLTIMILAYQEARVSELPSRETREEMQRIIFAKYVKSMLERHKALIRWRPEQIRSWLTFLAKQMQQYDQTFFAVENLWLPDEWEHRRTWCMRLIFGLIGALALGGYFELRGGPVAGLIAGLVAGVYFGRGAGQSPKVYFGNAGGVPGLLERQGPERILIPNHSIFLRVFWLVVLFVFEVVSALVILGPVKGLAWGLVMYLASLWEFLSPRKDFLSPNESIWDAGRRGLTGILVIGSLVCLAVEPFVGLFAGLCLGLTVGLFFAVFTEGLVRFVDHFLLRIFFARRGDLPWDLVAFLDEAAKRLLLHKVGGSYTFRHPLLLEYFASLDEAVSTESTSKSSKA